MSPQNRFVEPALFPHTQTIMSYEPDIDTLLEVETIYSLVSRLHMEGILGETLFLVVSVICVERHHSIEILREIKIDG